MKAKEIMTKNACYAKTNTNIYDVVKLMNDEHIGCLPICNENNKICGIITDRDVILRCVVANKNISQTPASEIMTTNVLTCKENDDMKDIQNIMSQNQIRRVPVCDDNNNVVGIITFGNLIQNSYELGKDNIATTFENVCDSNNKNSD